MSGATWFVRAAIQQLNDGGLYVYSLIEGAGGCALSVSQRLAIAVHRPVLIPWNVACTRPGAGDPNWLVRRFERWAGFFGDCAARAFRRRWAMPVML